MRRVLHVVSTLGVSGGMERTLLRTISGLSTRGFEQKVAFLSSRTDEILDVTEFAELIRIVPTKPRDPQVPWALRKLLRRFKPDVIHARNWGAWPDVAFARLTLRERPALFFSYHGTDETQKPSLKRKLAFKFLAETSTRILTVADAAADRLAELFPVPRSRIEIVRDGVDTDYFRPREGGRRPGPFVIGGVGRLMDIKNYPLLLKAAARASKRWPTLRVRIAGDGYLKEKLQALGNELGLGERLELIGHTENVPEYLQNLDLFVQSSDLEANPNALIEALAVGLPSVATNVGGTSEIADGGRAARLVPPKNERALADAIIDLLDDREERNRLAEAGRERAVSVYGQGAMIDAYERMYRSPRA